MESVIKDKSINRKKYYLIYSGIFLFCNLALISYLLINGKTNINQTSDGMNQGYRVLFYYSRYLKELFYNLLHNHRLVIPLFDFSLGEGTDIINSLHADAFGDPIMFLSVLIPEKYLWIFYFFNVSLKQYLAGVFFSELCFYLKKNNMFAVLAGTIVYTFCFWALRYFTLHIHFLSPLMFMPLLILGVEKIFSDEKPYVFILAVFFASTCWFYFFYAEAMCTAIYGIIRAFYKYRTDFKTIILKLLKTLGYALIGMLMAAIILSPIIISYTHDKRMGLKHPVGLLYNRFFYERLYTVFVGNDTPYDLVMGFVSPTLLALSILLRYPKKYKLILGLDILCLVFVCLPIGGMFLNGFAYVSQRWSFAIALPIAYSMVCAWDELKGNNKYMLFAILGIMGLSVFSAWSRNERGLVPVLFVILFYVVSHLNVSVKKKDICLICILLLNIFYIEQYHLSPRGKNVLSDMLSIEDAKSFDKLSEAYAIQQYTKDEKEFFRYTGNNQTNNASIMFDVNSTNFYFSITNPNDQTYRMKLDIRDRFSIEYKGYDSRAQLESLVNTKYYVAKQGYNETIPYGYELVQTDSKYDIYENQYFIPFGYTYKNTISYDKWNKLSVLEKQEAMLQAVVLDDVSNDYSLDLSNINRLDYQIKCDNGIEIVDNTIIVKDKDAKMTLSFDGEANVENYIIFNNLNFIDTENLIEDDYPSSTINIIASNGKTLHTNYLIYGHRYNYGKTDYAFYFGNSNEIINSYDVTFSFIGTYTFDDIYIGTVSMDKYGEYVDELSKEHMNNVIFDANKVSGEIDLDEDRYLVLSIPYSNGWTGKVDGQEVELLRANEHHTSIKLNKGHHTIELNYCTPGIKLGIVLEVIGFVLFGICVYLNKKN